MNNSKPTKRKLLILDLDETLVHTTEAPLPGIESDFRVLSYYVHVRPHAVEFLTRLAAVYDIAFWSAGGSLYVHAVLKKLLPDGFKPVFIWTSERCKHTRDVDNNLLTIKDLNKVRRRGFDLASVLIVDDTPSTAVKNYGNVIYVRAYEGQAGDCELTLLIAYLLSDQIKDAENVRKLEKRNWRQSVAS